MAPSANGGWDVFRRMGNGDWRWDGWFLRQDDAAYRVAAWQH